MASSHCSDGHGWIECSCICGLGGETIVSLQLHPDASIGQIHARLREEKVDPKSFSKIVIAGQVFDFTDLYKKVLMIPAVKKHLRENQLKISAQVLDLKIHEDLERADEVAGRFVKTHPLDFPMGVGDFYGADRHRKVTVSEWVQHLHKDPDKLNSLVWMGGERDDVKILGSEFIWWNPAATALQSCVSPSAGDDGRKAPPPPRPLGCRSLCNICLYNFCTYGRGHTIIGYWPHKCMECEHLTPPPLPSGGMAFTGSGPILQDAGDEMRDCESKPKQSNLSMNVWAFVASETFVRHNGMTSILVKLGDTRKKL